MTLFRTAERTGRTSDFFIFFQTVWAVYQNGLVVVVCAGAWLGCLMPGLIMVIDIITGWTFFLSTKPSRQALALRR